MSIYYIIYKTTHINGKYYIGRHQTDNLNDGYLGSGSWVNKIKNKSTLSRDILAEANCVEELKKLEEYYISLHWKDPMCMNKTKSSDGITSDEAKRINEILLANGTHNFLKRRDGTSVASEKCKKLIQEGRHPWQKKEDGTSFSSDMVKKGVHNLLKRPDGTSQALDNVKKGTNPFVRRPDGTSIGAEIARKMVAEGTHNLLGKVSCVNKQGLVKQIQKEQYNSQSGIKEDWEWVMCKSNEGKKRKEKLNFKFILSFS